MRLSQKATPISERRSGLEVSGVRGNLDHCTWERIQAFFFPVFLLFLDMYRCISLSHPCIGLVDVAYSQNMHAWFGGSFFDLICMRRILQIVELDVYIKRKAKWNGVDDGMKRMNVWMGSTKVLHQSLGFVIFNVYMYIIHIIIYIRS